MTQQYSSEGLAFSSNAMPHKSSQRLEGADEQSIEKDIHARIQGPSGPVQMNVPKSNLDKRRK